MSALKLAKDIAERYFARRERFPDEADETALLVVLLNYGDHLTGVSCVGPERWVGTKGDLAPRDGIPLCPNGHPMMEDGTRWWLGLVIEEPFRMTVPAGEGRFA